VVGVVMLKKDKGKSKKKIAFFKKTDIVFSEEKRHKIKAKKAKKEEKKKEKKPKKGKKKKKSGGKAAFIAAVMAAIAPLVEGVIWAVLEIILVK